MSDQDAIEAAQGYQFVPLGKPVELITLRDQIFCSALPAMLEVYNKDSMYGSDGVENRRLAVLRAWQLTDEALKQRNQPENVK